MAERIEAGGGEEVEELEEEVGEGVESPPLSLLLEPFDVFADGALFELLGFLLLDAGEVDRFVLGFVPTAPSEG